MRIAFGLPLAVAAALSVAQGGARPDDLPGLLKSAAEKSKTVRFIGTRRVTLNRGGKSETYLEYVTKDGPFLRIEFEAGSKFEGQVIVESPTLRKHYFPDRNELREAPFFSRRQFEGMRGGRGEKPKISDGGEVAGLPTTKAAFFGPNKKPIYEIYIHTESGLALKRVMFSPNGETSGTFEFQRVELNPKIAKKIFDLNPRGAKIVRPLDDLKRVASELKLPLIGFLKGDQLKLDFAASREIRGQKVLIQNYAKADSRVTLFVMSESVNPDELTKTGRRPGAAYAWKAFGQTLMLVGDVQGESLQELSKRVSQLGN